MQFITAVFSLLFAASCAAGNITTTYVGSTPAGPEVRAFFAIPSGDSVDFIRWQLRLTAAHYEVTGHYGISKPNTNGFIANGTVVTVRGDYKKESGRYVFSNGSKVLHATGWNSDLLHLTNARVEPLVGNAGYSYTLNRTGGLQSPAGAPPPPVPTFDSIELVGRTPCGISGIDQPGTPCYKIKWSLVLHSDPAAATSGSYAIRGTAWRDAGVRRGTWKLVRTSTGHPLYQLENVFRQTSIFLSPISNGLLLFTTADGQLLVGNEDFSYTLNRRG